MAALGPWAGQAAVAISEAAAAPLGDRPGLDIRIAARPDEAALFAALGKPAPRV
jgi:uroporphyrinogen-III synthase